MMALKTVVEIFSKNGVKVEIFSKNGAKVTDPEPPDPHVFGPPGSGSFYNQAK